jgi:lipoate-protein ligase A
VRMGDGTAGVGGTSGASAVAGADADWKPTRLLRVIDAGTVSAPRSQALWHGIAEAMSPGDAPVLSFCRPSEAYVGIGYHRRMDELDRAALGELGLPVIRRQIGGGPVYLDSDQLFFQLTLPAADAPPGPARLYSELLAPFVTALRRLGVAATLAGANDVIVDGRKVSGTGAGQIGEGVVLVGNVMFAFPHERMARVLALPDEEMRGECLRLLREHLAPLPHLPEERFKEHLARAYAERLGALATPASLRDDERRAIACWQERLLDPEWCRGPALPVPAGRQVKIRAGTWLYDSREGELKVRATIEEGQLRELRVHDPQYGDSAGAISGALLGAEATRASLAARLARFGEAGQRVLSTLAPGLVVR